MSKTKAAKPARFQIEGSFRPLWNSNFGFVSHSVLRISRDQATSTSPAAPPAGTPPHRDKHALVTDHATTIRDIRRQALHVGGYAVRSTYSEREKRWKVFVRLDRETYRNLRAHMLALAIRTSHRSPEAIEQEFRQLRWQPYEPVRLQLAAILKAVNRRRRYAGYTAISPSAIPTMRRITTVFADPCSMSSEAA